jgi:hypothetical protein
MNHWFLAAGILCAIAFPVHTFIGDRELRTIHPYNFQQEKTPKTKVLWLQSLCGWHMVSWDLLLAASVLLLHVFGVYSFSKDVFLLLTLYFIGYSLFWLLNLFISKARLKIYMLLPQWLLALTAGLLIYAGL